MFVEKKRTIITLEALVPAWGSAFERLYGEAPEVADLAIIYGKLCTECGHPGPKQACWNYNLGNIRGTAPDGQYTILQGAYEIFDADKVPAGWYVVPNTFGATLKAGKVCALPTDTSKQNFRSYSNLETACDDYVHMLGSRFKASWRALTGKNTNAEEFVLAMKTDRYFTGDVTQYQYNVGSIARAVIPKVEILMQKDAETQTYEILSTFEDPATFLRAGPGEHTVGLEDVVFEDQPWFRRLFGKLA